jgi:hypothetical protein
MFHRSRTEPAAGQDYPRPPRLQKVSERLRVIFTGETIADTVAGFRVLETAIHRSITSRPAISTSSICARCREARGANSRDTPNTGRLM